MKYQFQDPSVQLYISQMYTTLYLDVLHTSHDKCEDNPSYTDVQQWLITVMRASITAVTTKYRSHLVNKAMMLWQD